MKSRRPRPLSDTLVCEMKSNTWSYGDDGSSRRGGSSRGRMREKRRERRGRETNAVQSERAGQRRRRIFESGKTGVGIAIKAICCIVPAIRRRQLSPTVLTSSQGLSAAWSTCALSISLSSCPVERRPRRPPCSVRNFAYNSGA